MNIHARTRANALHPLCQQNFNLFMHKYSWNIVFLERQMVKHLPTHRWLQHLSNMMGLNLNGLSASKSPSNVIILLELSLIIIKTQKQNVGSAENKGDWYFLEKVG